MWNYTSQVGNTGQKEPGLSTGPGPVKPASPKLPSVNPLRKELGEAKVPCLKRVSGTGN